MIDYGYGIQLGTILEKGAWLFRVWRNDTRINRWCRQYGLIDEISQGKWLNKIATDPSIMMYSIYTPTDNQVDDYITLQGVCGFTGITPVHNSAEFSIYIDPDKHKMGYGKAALQTLLHHGFEDLNFNRIWGESFDKNPAMSLYDKLGFQKEGTLRETYYKEGQYWDSHIYSLIRSDWNAMHPASR